MIKFAQSYKELKSKFKEQNLYNHPNAIRLHRAISWLNCAEQNIDNTDVCFINLWISFNACYANSISNDNSERKVFNDFVEQLVHLDKNNLFFNVLWDKFSGPVSVLIKNEFAFQPFWDFHKTQVGDWKNAFDKSIYNANKNLGKQNTPGVLKIVLDRLYTVRNQIMHGGATFNSTVNRSQVEDATKILAFIVPITIEIMLDNINENWGKISYPLIENNYSH